MWGFPCWGGESMQGVVVGEIGEFPGQGDVGSGFVFPIAVGRQDLDVFQHPDIAPERDLAVL